MVQKIIDPYVKNEKDTYLTLDVLADILKELSDSGKSFNCFIMYFNHKFCV